MTLRPFPVPLPARMSRLPVSRGYPVPAFVAWYGGEPKFPIVDQAHFVRCVQHKVCWICGDRLGGHVAFVIGPPSVVTRTYTEPPSHRECAEFAVRVCPFMLSPRARHRDIGIPDAGDFGGGSRANPGCAVVWITKGYTTFPEGDKTLFKIGEPVELQWWTEGRRATPDEAAAFLEVAIADLHELARQHSEQAVRDVAAAAEVARMLAGGR